ncbi:carboxymuconolactone decarboxylase family protein [Rhodococcus tukisamuensis]|uniref:Alkylhydroperoxidase AhpD family core domain-containing protein n=1 Tax=Rhodococcus tukisamuensis TaxID=168276 RepID=A0A1G6MFQ9_9NOCA|nr:carboxymuconolactone decarboxylase family protein [Rhodococcus tukisamuensis]SDC54359.1 alkylhydroperoxidase AhpD family core domain-containing protein [Rhodococcus tukisamuensis]
MTFTAHTAETAPAAARPIMAAIEQQFGFLPAASALMAESPELMQAFARANALFERSTLTHLEREVVVFAIATRNECHLCVALHSAGLTRDGASPELTAALRERRPLDDPRLEALRQFTLAVLDSAGAVDDARMRAFLDVGFSTRQALEVVLGVGTYTLSTFANRMTGAHLDEPFARFAWDGAA